MAQEHIRIGIVGAGANTRSRHIPGLQAIEGVEIVAVCNRSNQSSRRVADEFGISRIEGDWHALVTSPNVDAVVIGTWPYMHCPVTIAALEAGKHVLCEARMAMDAAEARRMFEAAQARPRQIAQIVPSPMTLVVDRTIQRRIGEGWLGDVLAVEIRDGGDFVDRQAPLHWREDRDLSGWNVMSLGIWYEAMMRWVGEATRVTAMGRTFVPVRADACGRRRAVRIPDHIDVTAELACGGQAHFQISRVTGLAGPPAATIYGSQGTLRFTEGKLYGGRRGDEKLMAITIRPEDRGAWRVEEEFVNAIRGLEPVTHTDLATGVKYMAFTEAVARSMAEGRTVAV